LFSLAMRFSPSVRSEVIGRLLDQVETDAAHEPAIGTLDSDRPALAEIVPIEKSP